jgi:hypothetical protein
MNLSGILDISSFFIGMIINLLLIALICYYFKKKYENLEIAQNEQAKVLYDLLRQNSTPKVMNINDILGNVKNVTEPDSDSDSDSDSDDDSVQSNESKTKTINLDTNEICNTTNTLVFEKTVNSVNNVNEVEVEVEITNTTILDLKDKDYSKMTIKQLKDILTSKGLNGNKMKKNEMIQMIEGKSSININELEELNL